MRRLSLLLCCLIALTLAGCSEDRQVENQAFVVILGLDIREENELGLAAIIPGETGKSDDPSGESAYELYKSAGRTFPEALETLTMVSPRRVNLTQTKMIVLSEALARSMRCASLLQELAETYTLYSSSFFTVCEGEAGIFLKCMIPELSAGAPGSLAALMEYHSEQGTIPGTTFADVYYRSHSVYSDPIAVLAGLEEKRAPVSSGSDDEGKPATQQKPVYAGGALFRDGVMAGKLDAEQMAYANVLQGKVKEISFFHDNWGVRALVDGRPHFKIDTSVKPSAVTCTLMLRAYPLVGSPGLADIKTRIEQEMLAVLQKCADLRVEPFGLAELVACRYPTIQKWEDVDWREMFANARIVLRIDVQASQR